MALSLRLEVDRLVGTYPGPNSPANLQRVDSLPQPAPLPDVTAGRPIFGTALATADSVYFTCDNGYLFRLKREDGKEVWRYDLGDARASRILAHPVAPVRPSCGQAGAVDFRV